MDFACKSERTSVPSGTRNAEWHVKRKSARTKRSNFQVHPAAERPPGMATGARSTFPRVFLSSPRNPPGVGFGAGPRSFRGLHLSGPTLSSRTTRSWVCSIIRLRQFIRYSESCVPCLLFSVNVVTGKYLVSYAFRTDVEVTLSYSKTLVSRLTVPTFLEQDWLPSWSSRGPSVHRYFQERTTL